MQTTRETCKRCKGTGIEWVMLGEEPEKDVCSVCDGTGVVDIDEDAGPCFVDDSQQLGD